MAYAVASANDRLSALGHSLPRVSADPRYADYRTVDSAIHVSGQLPYQEGRLVAEGVLGADLDVEAVRPLAVQAVLNALAVAADAAGGLDRVRVVEMLAFVASAPGFGDQSKVADAASDLLVDVLGENGRHARTAIGVAALPRNSPVEIRLVCCRA